jgi:hypothetical protein
MEPTAANVGSVPLLAVTTISYKEGEATVQLEQVEAQEVDDAQIQPDKEEKDDKVDNALPSFLNISKTCLAV